VESEAIKSIAQSMPGKLMDEVLIIEPKRIRLTKYHRPPRMATGIARIAIRTKNLRRSFGNDLVGSR
jgi:hypothetical protein